MSETYTNPVAEVRYPDSGWIVTPEETRELRDSPEFFCPDFDCKDPARKLILKRSQHGNLFFSHRPGYGHSIHPQTLLHKLAVKWFEGKTEFEFPPYTKGNTIIKRQNILLNPAETRLEYSRLKQHVPDVKIQSVDGFSIAIEIVVTNDISDKKAKIIEQFGLPTVRIELTSFYRQYPTECKINKEFVESKLDELLTDIKRKSWVHFPEIDPLPQFATKHSPAVNNQTGNPGCLIVMPIIGFSIYLLYSLLSSNCG